MTGAASEARIVLPPGVERPAKPAARLADGKCPECDAGKDDIRPTFGRLICMKCGHEERSS
jgi:hypothetical protein